MILSFTCVRRGGEKTPEFIERYANCTAPRTESLPARETKHSDNAASEDQAIASSMEMCEENRWMRRRDREADGRNRLDTLRSSLLVADF